MGINKAANYFLASMLDLIYKSGLPPSGLAGIDLLVTIGI